MSNAQKLPIMLNIMPMTTAIMPQFLYDFIIIQGWLTAVIIE